MAIKKSVGDLKEDDLKGKKVFVRVDLNVPLDDNFNITDDIRIRAAVPTIKYLMGHGSKAILSSHLVIYCGILLVLMAVGNFINTIQTLVTKSRFKAKMKRSKRKQILRICYTLILLFSDGCSL
ncbi:hypothetical protein CXB51_025471 [Gossypium anomalum]|uniref:Phosphoglycerate kinase n=1 Tax=Gossypium anomalum TaxID=47600 RepID=A0A8J5YE92_9ROSI|nr:hypothetical protein CXB51_025471 [Gossypium anomalum]